MAELHIFFLPFLSPGHMIPLADLARLFAARPGVKATVVTTAGANAESIEAITACSPHHIAILTLPFPPSLPQNASQLPIPADFMTCPEFVEAVEALKGPFDRLVDAHRPNCIISDMLLPWSGDVASDHGVPRLIYTPMGAFAAVIQSITSSLDLASVDSDGAVAVPGIPHPIEMAKSQLIPPADSRRSQSDDLFARIVRGASKSCGDIVNSFAEMEAGYFELLRRRPWVLGPLTHSNRRATTNDDACMRWLDRRKPGSVIYACFGSVTKFAGAQLGEIAEGLQDCDHPFIWVVGNVELFPEGIEERIAGGGKGLIVRGWAPQTAILGHAAVGGFLTHCGWNSCLEGAAAGVPMVTWPQFGDHFYNERLLVDVLRIGVPVGVKVSSASSELRTFVKRVEVTMSVNEVMGGGGEAEGRRKRAKEIAAKAREAMEEGGASYMDMSRLIKELVDLKRPGVGVANSDELFTGSKKIRHQLA